MKTQFTFPVKDLLNLLAKNVSAKQVLVTVDTNSKRPFIASNLVQGTEKNDAAEDPEPTIYGCPYPPGCTE